MVTEMFFASVEDTGSSTLVLLLVPNSSWPISVTLSLCVSWKIAAFVLSDSAASAIFEMASVVSPVALLVSSCVSTLLNAILRAIFSMCFSNDLTPLSLQ